MKLVINPGHGQKNIGEDPGAIGPDGLKESVETAEVGNLVASKLRYNGIDVLVIQDGDLWDVTNGANAWAAPNDLFISIHCNSFSDPSAHGVETFAYQSGGKGERLARAIQSELVAATGLTDRGIKFGNLHVLRETDMPAALVEIGFISNPNELALMESDSWDDLVATAISRGFCEFIGQEYQEEVQEVPAPIPVLVTDKNTQAISLMEQAIELLKL